MIEGGIVMSKGDPSTLSASIIIAGLFIAGAIIFAPSISGVPQNSDPKRSNVAGAGADSDTQSKQSSRQSETTVLKITSAEFNIHSWREGFFFIDGVFRHKAPLNRFMGSYEVDAGTHRLCWVFYQKDVEPGGNICCITTSVTIEKHGQTEYRLPKDFGHLVNFSGDFAGSKDGMRIYVRKNPDIGVSYADQAKRAAQIEEGLKQFSSYDLLNALSTGFGARESARGQIVIPFPEDLGGRRTLNTEEMSLLKKVVMGAFDNMTGLGGIKFAGEETLWTVRKSLEEQLDTMVAALNFAHNE
jgi:hypothetical protein